MTADAWESILARMEAEVSAAEATDDPDALASSFSRDLPEVPGPFPTELIPRAKDVLSRMAAVERRLEALLAANAAAQRPVATSCGLLIDVDA